MSAKKNPKVVTRIEKAASSVDAFELLLPTQHRRKWNVGKTYHGKVKPKTTDQKRILPFQNADTKEMIVQWLSNTQNKFGRITQSQEIYDFCEDDNNSFSLPSVSQNKLTSKNKHLLRSSNTITLRSRNIARPRSLELKRVKTAVQNSLIKRPKLSFDKDSCDYNIEEFDTGPKISAANMEDPSVQKNIIQQLEDDFLDSIETEVDITKYNSKTNKLESTVLSSGWDRMKQMKKTVCKDNKKMKKLKTLVQINTHQPGNTGDCGKSCGRPKNTISKDPDVILNPPENTTIIRKGRGRPKKVVKARVTNKNLTPQAKVHPVTILLNVLNNNPLKNKVEIIDLTIVSPEKNKSANEKEVDENCKVIITDIFRNQRIVEEVQDFDEIQVVVEESVKKIEEPSTSKNITGVAKSKYSLKRTANFEEKNHETDNIDDFFLMSTPKATVNNDETEKADNEDIENTLRKKLQNIYPSEEIGFLLATEKSNVNEKMLIRDSYELSKTAIRLEIERLQKLIQTSSKLEDEHKNMLKSKLDDIVQIFESSFCIDKAKVFETIGIQTDGVSLKDASVQIETSTRSAETQTSSAENMLSKFTQTTERINVLNLDKSVQTSLNAESNLQADFAVQVRENDLNLTPEKLIMNSLVKKYLGEKDTEGNQSKLENRILPNLQNKVARTEKVIEGLNSSSDEIENICNQVSILTENMIDTSAKDELNNAICLTESEKTYSKPNSPPKSRAKNTQASPKTQVESIGIITQTQQSNVFKKCAPVESVGIISQTQMSRSPIKLCKKAKLPSPRLSLSPIKESPQKTNSKSIEKETELSDSLDNLEYNTADILAGGNITINQTSNIEVSVKSDKVNRKLDFDKGNMKRMKRIRFPDDSDSDSDDVQPRPKKRAKNKFVRDDLSIEFQTEAVNINANADSDNLLPEELPDVCYSDYADDFDFKDCLRKIENNFDPDAKKSTTPTKSVDNEKPSTSKLTTNIIDIPKINHAVDKHVQLESTKVHDDALIFKSPVKRPKRSILSEIICPIDTEKSPAKVQILENILVQNAVNKSPESDMDFDGVICSDESLDENIKLRTFEPNVWNTPSKKDTTNDPRNTSNSQNMQYNIFKLPSLGETPDMFNLPSEGEDVFLAPPAEFANSAPDLSKCLSVQDDNEVLNVPLSAQDPKIDSTVNSNNPVDTSTQKRQLIENKSPGKHDYDILSLSPIKPEDNLIDKEANSSSKRCALTIIKRDKPKAKPLNISSHSTPKVKQNSIFSYIKRTQNRIHLNTSSSSLFHETEELINQQNNNSQTIEKTNNDRNVPCIACSRLNKDDLLAVTSLVRKKLITFRNSFEKNVTHLIVSVNKSNFVKDHTMKYISAVSAGIWILNSEWIKTCIGRNEIVDEEPYEVLDVSGSTGPKESRLYRQIRPLLSKFRILAAPPFRASERSVIEDVIRNLGGFVVDDAIQFLNKGGKINLVIKEALSTQSFSLDDDWLNVYQVATVDIEWLSRSVGQYKTLSFLPFLLCDADDLQDLNVYPEEFLVDIPGFTFSTQPETE